MLYDTHCHPYLSKEKSQKETLERFFCGSNRYLNSVAVDISTSLHSIHLAEEYIGVYASIGIHPTSTHEYIGRQERVIKILSDLYKKYQGNIVAIGECWLDYYWLEKISTQHNISQKDLKQTQKDFFIAQIRLAKKLKLPLIIHNREASEDILEILKAENFTNFVFHCYSEDLNFAQRLIDFAPDCKLWFGWVVTFKNAKSVQDAVQSIPLKNIIIETDAPYLTPVPYRGKEENEALYTQYVLEKIIELRDESPEEITKTIFENSTSFFKIKKQD